MARRIPKDSKLQEIQELLSQVQSCGVSMYKSKKRRNEVIDTIASLEYLNSDKEIGTGDRILRSTIRRPVVSWVGFHNVSSTGQRQLILSAERPRQQIGEHIRLDIRNLRPAV